MYNPDYQRLRGRLSEFCTINRSNPWRQSTDTSRKVVGWAMRRRLEAIMVQEALHMALGRRKPSAGLMQHSDRGSQDACHAYQRLLGTHGIGCSMSRQGECLDNAVAERFFGS
jgi:putative transposase